MEIRPVLEPARAAQAAGWDDRRVQDGVHTQRINLLRGRPGEPVWQRDFHEHIIRNEEELDRIRRYIASNPLQWALDEENPAAMRKRPEEPWQV